MSVVMPTMAVVVVAVVVEMPNLNQPRPAAIIFLRPRSVTVAGRIGVVRTRCFGTGRETGQQDYRREESKPAHALDMVSLRRDDKIAGQKQAALQGNVIVYR
jgi:hypothetical protein